MATQHRRSTMSDNDAILLSTLVAHYAIFNRVTGKSPQTVDWYNARLALFQRFAGEEASLADLTAERVRAYIVHLQERRDRHANNPFMPTREAPLSSSYIQGCVRALRAFASWLEAEGYTKESRLRRVRPPKIERKVIQVLSDEEVARILARFNRDDPFGARNHAAVWTLLDCGLRASELCHIALEDAHIEQGYLKVMGKGAKERLVPIGAGSQRALLRWRDQFRPRFLLVPSPWLFLNANGACLTLNALEEVVKRAGLSAGVPRITCHLLRHTFATNYLVKEVGDPLRLQQVLGHSALEMVRSLTRFPGLLWFRNHAAPAVGACERSYSTGLRLLIEV